MSYWTDRYRAELAGLEKESLERFPKRPDAPVLDFVMDSATRYAWRVGRVEGLCDSILAYAEAKEQQLAKSQAEVSRLQKVCDESLLPVPE